MKQKADFKSYTLYIELFRSWTSFGTDRHFNLIYMFFYLWSNMDDVMCRPGRIPARVWCGPGSVGPRTLVREDVAAVRPASLQRILRETIH